MIDVLFAVGVHTSQCFPLEVGQAARNTYVAVEVLRLVLLALASDASGLAFALPVAEGTVSTITSIPVALSERIQVADDANFITPDIARNRCKKEHERFTSETNENYKPG